MEAQREGLRAAYTTDRLAHRVRVVPKRHVNLLGTERFEVRDSQGNYVTYHRLKRIGYRSGAYKFGELFDKHGRHHWIEPLLDELGPYVQLQLNDLANIFEVFAALLHVIVDDIDLHAVAEGSCQNPRIHAQTTRKQLVKQRVDQINQENGGGGPPSHVVPNVIVNGDRSYEEDDWPSACSTNSAFNTIIGFSGLQ
ncbi:MAG: hypothetical protein Q9196_000082 [Gyalolechia fulgens]